MRMLSNYEISSQTEHPKGAPTKNECGAARGCDA